MNDTITTIYYLSDKFLKAIRHREDPQAHLSTAEVMSVPLVALTFFGANIDKARLLLKARMALRTVCEAHPSFLAILGAGVPHQNWPARSGGGA